MRSTSVRLLAALVAVLLSVGTAAGPAGAAPRPKLKVLTESVQVKQFKVPVKVRCKAGPAQRCTGTLKLVLGGQGSPKRTYSVRGGTKDTVRLPLSERQVELLAAFGAVEGYVRVKERKPRALDGRKSPIVVAAP